MEEGFCYKHQITDETKVVEITADIVFVPRKTKFGDTYPQEESFWNFIGLKYYLVGHGNFNRLHLSTQLPARFKFVIDRPLPELIYQGWNQPWNQSTVEVKPEVFEKFSEIEYAFVDALVHFDHITYDGYFKSQRALFKGIFHKMIEYRIKKHAIVTEAVRLRPELLTRLSPSEKKYIIS